MSPNISVITTNNASVGATQTTGNAFGVAQIGGGGGYYGGRTGGANNHVSGGSGGSSFISGHTGCNAINTSGAHTGQPNHYSGLRFTGTVMIDGIGRGWTNVVGAVTPMPNPNGGNYANGTGHTSSGVAIFTYLGE